MATSYTKYARRGRHFFNLFAQIVFLDEPSTGMDPMARRLMWNFVMRVVTQNKECAMVLTTHR